MKKEKIAPKVNTKFNKLLKETNIPLYISNLLNNISENNNIQTLNNKLKELEKFLANDVKLQNIFFNFGWNELNKNFSKEINFLELNVKIRKEYEINANSENEEEYLEDYFNSNEKNEIIFFDCNYDKENNKYLVSDKNSPFDLVNYKDKKLEEFKENNFISNEKHKNNIKINFVDNYNHTDLNIENRECMVQDKNLSSKKLEDNAKLFSFECDNESISKNEVNENVFLGSPEYKIKKRVLIDENPEKFKTDYLEKEIIDKEMQENNLNKIEKQSILLSSNKKNLSIAEEELDEFSTNIKKPIATTLTNNSFPLDFSKSFLLIANEQNQNFTNNSISCFNEDNSKMQNMSKINCNNINLNNNYPNKITNSDNNNFNKNLIMNNNNFLENSDSLQKIITPKFNKIICANNPLTTLNMTNSLNNTLNNSYIENNMINNIQVNINYNNNQNNENNNYFLNNQNNANKSSGNSNIISTQYLNPNSPNYHFNSSIFRKSNFTKNESNFNYHSLASPRNTFTFNQSSAFNINPNIGNFPINSPNSNKTIELNSTNMMVSNQSNFVNSNFHINNNQINNQNVYYFNNMNNNNLYNPNEISKNFYNGKYTLSNPNSVISNKIVYNSFPQLKTKNLSFFETDDNDNFYHSEDNVSSIDKKIKENLDFYKTKINNIYNNKNNYKENYLKNINSLEMKNNKKNKYIKDEKKEDLNLIISEKNNDIYNCEYINDNVSIIRDQKNSFYVIINKEIFSENLEDFPIIEKLSKIKSPAKRPSLDFVGNNEQSRQKRSIQRNKRFFDEEQFHFDNSFKKIITPKNKLSENTIRNFIDNNLNKEKSYLNENLNNFTKRKRKKINRLHSKTALLNKEKGNIESDDNENEEINNNKDLNFYEFNLGKRIYKKRNNNNQKEKISDKDESNISINEACDLNKANFYSAMNLNLKIKKTNSFNQNEKSYFKNNLNDNTNRYSFGINENREKSQNSKKRKKRKSKKNNLSHIKKRNFNNKFNHCRNTSYGLKEISKNVLKIVKRCKSTTYKEISDMIVNDINVDLNGTKDEKNIRRRIYDSLNVMKAINIFKKERNLKNIVFNNSPQNAFLLNFLDKEDSFKSSHKNSFNNEIQNINNNVFCNSDNSNQNFNSLINNNYIQMQKNLENYNSVYDILKKENEDKCKIKSSIFIQKANENENFDFNNYNNEAKTDFKINPKLNNFNINLNNFNYDENKENMYFSGDNNLDKNINNYNKNLINNRPSITDFYDNGTSNLNFSGFGNIIKNNIQINNQNNNHLIANSFSTNFKNILQNYNYKNSRDVGFLKNQDSKIKKNIIENIKNLIVIFIIFIMLIIN